MPVQSRANPARVGANRLVQLLGQWSGGAGPLYRQLADRIAEIIAQGSLHAGEQLPPERALAEALSVSRGTVVRAFEELTADGAVTRVQGRGTTVTGQLVNVRSESDDFVGERLWMEDRSAVDLLKANPLMLPEVADLVASLDLAPHAADLDSVEPLGWWSLRECIAEHHTRQGLPTTPHQIMVTSGATQAISLVVRAMARSGDVVLGEEHTWPGVIDSVQNLGARYEPVRLDHDGMIIDDLQVKIDRYRPTLMVVNPQHQNPTGSRLPSDRVEAIAALIRRHRIPTLEDRVSADLAFDRRHLPALDEHDTGGYGLITGSICKAVWPGFRMGWLRGDAQVINSLRSHKAVADMFTPPTSQILGLAVLEQYDTLLDQRITRLRAAADMVIDTLRSELSEWTFVSPRGGLSIWVTLPNQTSATSFVQHASRHGVLIASGGQFSVGDVDGPHIRIPFTAAPDTLAEGLRRIVAAWRSFDRNP